MEVRRGGEGSEKESKGKSKGRSKGESEDKARTKEEEEGKEKSENTGKDKPRGGYYGHGVRKGRGVGVGERGDLIVT